MASAMHIELRLFTYDYLFIKKKLMEYSGNIPYLPHGIKKPQLYGLCFSGGLLPQIFLPLVLMGYSRSNECVLIKFHLLMQKHRS